MDFAFSDEQDEFRAVVRRFIEERWSAADARKLAETPAGFDRGVWKQMAEELGLHGLALPEAVGGQGFGFLELGIALEEMGRQLAGGPFLASAVVAAHAIEHGATDAQRAELLPELASGATIATLALLEASGRHVAADIAATARRDGAGFRIAGRKIAVLDAQNADLLLVAAREAGTAGEAGISLFAVRSDAAGVTIAATDGLDLTRRLGAIDFSDAPATLLGDAGAAWPAIARTLDLGGDRRGGRVGRRHRALSRNGGGLREVAHPVRAPDRLVPGDQAQDRRGDARAGVGTLGGLLVVVGRRAARGFGGGSRRGRERRQGHLQRRLPPRRRGERAYPRGCGVYLGVRLPSLLSAREDRGVSLRRSDLAPRATRRSARLLNRSARSARVGLPGGLQMAARAW